jgi:hypothetical protein
MERASRLLGLARERQLAEHGLLPGSSVVETTLAFSR